MISRFAKLLCWSARCLLLVMPLALIAAEGQPEDIPVPANARPSVQDRWSQMDAKTRHEYSVGVGNRERFIRGFPVGAAVYRDIPYAREPFQGLRPSSDQYLDLYVPPGEGPFPITVLIHGGAWKGGSKDGLGADLASRWLPAGIAVASIDYRFVFDAQFPGMFQDALDALDYLRGSAAKYHIDIRHISIMGMSAGAHIAGVAAFAENAHGYQRCGPPAEAVVLLCGFYDLTVETGAWKPGSFIANPRDDFSNLYPERRYDPEIARKMSPVHLVTHASPPTFVVHGDKDTTAPLVQSDLLTSRMQALKAPVVSRNFPDLNHNLWTTDVLTAAREFIRKPSAAVQAQPPGPHP